ncbi:DoxX family membrane protein [Chlorobium sp. BLA1]|uniref:DoxX family membrane protein n=1 Tax=Candidatus Chlorobium masyuteum TaxID=2716876 RepID=UPI001423356B|nr:DoxX family membrane protein [Candidatus Chlorobium masyuteum]NHQ60498.1 DoxX family membrane protein [Candidatus Chlorobium masyuteum]NTU43923.1 DoxX family membrane protein [Chlorobiaceae bacterium]
MKRFEWKRDYFKHYPLKTAGVILFLSGRYLFALFFLYGFWHKLVKGWLWSDLMQFYFLKRLAELPAESFQALYLQQFAIPLAFPIAWIVTVGELIIGIGLIFGIAVRANAAFALFLVVNFAAGGYYNLTLPPFMLYALLMIISPSGHWLGLDRILHNKYPAAIWFK